MMVGRSSGAGTREPDIFIGRAGQTNRFPARDVNLPDIHNPRLISVFRAGFDVPIHHEAIGCPAWTMPEFLPCEPCRELFRGAEILLFFPKHGVDGTVSGWTEKSQRAIPPLMPRIEPEGFFHSLGGVSSFEIFTRMDADFPARCACFDHGARCHYNFRCSWATLRTGRKAGNQEQTKERRQ